MITFTSADNALKTLYLGVVAEQLNTAVNPLLARFEQTTSDVWGKEIRKLVPCYSGGCNVEATLQFVLTLKNLYATIEISDKAIRASAGNAGAFVNLLQTEMEELMRVSKFNIGRMLYGDGSGKLCTVIDVNENTLTVDSVVNVTEGIFVDVLGNVDKAPVVSARRILDVDREERKITLSGTALTATVSAGDFLSVQGYYNKELTGLDAIFGDSKTLYGLDRASNKWLNPRKYTSTQINNEIIQTAIDELDTVGSAVDYIVCSYGVKRAYWDYLVTSRTNIDVMNLQGDYKAISYNGIPVVSDRFVPKGTMYLLNTADFHLHQLCDWRWLEGDDGRIIRQTPNKPAYTAMLVKYADLICDRPNGQAVISGIVEAK